MSSTAEEIIEMKDTVVKVLEQTTRHPTKIFIGYDYFEGSCGSMSTSNPKIEIEWGCDDNVKTKILP